jgi:hypothetical protein
VVSLLGIGARSDVSLGGRVGSGCWSCTRDVTGTQVPGADASGVAAGWAAQRRPIGGGGHGDLLEDGRWQLKPGQNTRQRPDSQLADRPPDSLIGMPGAVEHRGGLDRAERSAPGRRIQGRGRAAGVGRAGGMSGLDAAGWPAPAAAVALCRCPILQSAAVALRLASAVPEARGQGRVDAYTGEGSRRDGLGGLMRVGSAASCARVTPSQPDESWLPRPPAAWPSGGWGYL